MRLEGPGASEDMDVWSAYHNPRRQQRHRHPVNPALPSRTTPGVEREWFNFAGKQNGHPLCRKRMPKEEVGQDGRLPVKRLDDRSAPKVW